MSDAQFVAKAQLISLIERVISKGETGLISVLTDANRSVLLKFAEGKLIHAYCRTRDVGEVIQVLNESATVKFSIVPIPVETGFEVMPGAAFLQLLEAGVSSSLPSTAAPAPAKPQKTIEVESTKELLENLASQYLGLVAEVIVEEALDSSSNIEAVIDYIAQSIPDKNQAVAFLNEAKKATHLISM